MAEAIVPEIPAKHSVARKPTLDAGRLLPTDKNSLPFAVERTPAGRFLESTRKCDLSHDSRRGDESPFVSWSRAAGIGL